MTLHYWFHKYSDVKVGVENKWILPIDVVSTYLSYGNDNGKIPNFGCNGSFLIMAVKAEILLWLKSKFGCNVSDSVSPTVVVMAVFLTLAVRTGFLAPAVMPVFLTLAVRILFLTLTLMPLVLTLTVIAVFLTVDVMAVFLTVCVMTVFLIPAVMEGFLTLAGKAVILTLAWL